MLRPCRQRLLRRAFVPGFAAGIFAIGLVTVGCARVVNEQADVGSTTKPRSCSIPTGRTIVEFESEFFERDGDCSVVLRAEDSSGQIIVHDLGDDDVLAVGRLPESCREPYHCDWQAAQSSIGPFFLAVRTDDSGEYARRAWLFWVSQGWIRNVELTLGETGFADSSTTGSESVLDPWICGSKLGLFVESPSGSEAFELSYEANLRQGLYQADGEGWYVLPASKPPAGCTSLASLMVP